MRYLSTMVYGKQLPVLTYDKDYIHNNEEKDTVSLFLYPSTHKLLNVFKGLFEFPTIDDAIVAAILHYNRYLAEGVSHTPTIPYYSGDEQVIAIAGDNSRRMNRKKRKRGKSLVPNRSEAFKSENLVFEDGS